MPKIAETAEFTGRSREIAKLTEILESAAHGEGQLAFVYGEAGIGKTRLIKEIRQHPIGKTFNWLTARCIFHEGTDPYLPFFDALKGGIGPTIQEPKKSTEISDEHVTTDGVHPAELSKIPVIGPELAEDPSMPFGSFMIKEPKSDFSLAAFSALINRGHKGLCITRIPPNKLGNLTKHDDVNVLWLSKKPGESTLPPSLTKLSHEITSMVKKQPNSVVMVDGLEYVISNVEFSKVLRFMNELVDSMAVHKSILLIPMNPLTMDRQQLALLERDMTTFDMTASEQFQKRDTGDDLGAPPTHKFNGDGLRQGRDRMFETITMQLLDIASNQPVVLVIDDLHWADEGVLHLLHYIARAVKNQPVAIIGSYRPEDLADTEKIHPLQTSLNRMTQEKIVKQIFLDRFMKDETADIIQSLLGTSKFPKKIIDFIYKETEGNPFFIEEVLRSLEEEKVIEFNEEMVSWKLTKRIPEITLPDTIKDAVNSRTDRLDKTMRHLLESASVIGVEFGYDILASVSAQDEEQLVTNLDDLVRLKLITERPAEKGQPVRYRFAHNKICEALYEGLGQSRKLLLHNKTAAAIEEMHDSDLDSVVFTLAHHFYHGGDYRRGLHYVMNAGEKALMGFAPEKAKTFYEWALESIELIETRPSETVSNQNQQTEIYAKLTEISILIGEWDDAIEYSNKLLQLSKDLENHWKLADAHINLGKIHLFRSMWKESINHYKKALSITEKSNYLPGQMEVNYGLGVIHEKMGEYIEAMEYYQQFMELALPLDSPSDIARGYKAFGKISTQRGEYDTALEYYNKCIELLSKTNNYSELSKAYTAIGVTYYELDKFENVIEWNEKCIELTSRTGDIRMKGYGYSNAAEAYARMNNLKKASEYANYALEIFTKLDEKTMIGLVWMNFGIIYKQKKDWPTARTYFEKSITILKDQNIPYYLADCTRQLGLMLADQGTPETLEESRKYLQYALEIYKNLGAVKYIDVVRSELNE